MDLPASLKLQYKKYLHSFIASNVILTGRRPVLHDVNLLRIYYWLRRAFNSLQVFFQLVEKQGINVESIVELLNLEFFLAQRNET